MTNFVVKFAATRLPMRESCWTFWNDDESFGRGNICWPRR